VELAMRNLDDRIFTVLAAEIRHTFGLGNTGITAIAAVALPFAFLIDPFVSYVADRRRRTRMLAFAMGTFAFFTALTGVAGFMLALGLLFLARIGAATINSFNSTRNSLLADYYPARVRPKVFYAVQVSGTLGDVVGPVMAGILGGLIGWQWPFILMAVPPFLCLFLLLRLKE